MHPHLIFAAAITLVILSFSDGGRDSYMRAIAALIKALGEVDWVGNENKRKANQQRDRDERDVASREWSRRHKPAVQPQHNPEQGRN